MSGAHASPAAEVCARLGSNPELGLTEDVAAERLRLDGPNRMPEPPPASVAGLVARQFANALVALLLGAAALSFALGELLEGAVILAIVVANAALGALQEGRADSAARALRSLLAPHATVVRGGSARDVDAAELVEGDVVLLTAGDRVPADARLLSAERLEIGESILTGESQPAGKRAEPPDRPEAQLGDRATMAFAGTTATRGRGRALVTGTSLRTEVGRIAEAVGGPRRRTPLQRRLDRVAGVLLEVSVAICLGLAAIAWANGDSLADSLLVGVSLAVAAVPEGLAAVVTVTLALGMSRLAQRGAVVRRLRAVETLGSTTVICTDKTGTLTANRMRVERLRAPGGEHELLAAAIIASEGSTDPGEAAIAAAGAERGIERERLLDGMALVGGEPFDAERKRMSVVVEDERGRRRAYVKGAPEVLLPRVAADAAIPELEQLATDWADSGVRLLLVAERPDLPPGGEPEEALRPLGLIGIVDPPRESALPSVDRARRAGIRTVMITGDHPRTAIAVARACGIVPDDRPPVILTGQELDHLSEDELRDLVGRVEIYARVVPQQKLRIVAALQDAGEVVAMTGDGVNDAPALAAADIGVAMGSGSDAAIDASDVVLTDNDFATIVVAVDGGRTIYANIQRFLQFLLAANAGEVLAFALAIVPGLGAPLTVAQILLVNLLTDGMPAVALGVDPPDERSMEKPPRPPRRACSRGCAAIWCWAGR